MYTFSKRSRDNLQGVHPNLVMVVERALELSAVDFTVIEGVRTIEKQREYFANGASKTMNSYHLKRQDGFGYAVDLYPFYAGKVQVEAPFSKFKAISEAMKAAASKLGFKITWGGDWKSFVDSPHYQLEG